MVNYLTFHRTQYCDRDVLELDERTIRELISQDVLHAKPLGTLGFSHQTLEDCLTVRASLAKQQTLKSFIVSQPQLPFIRPFIRAFLFHLRVHQSERFSQQVTQVIASHEVSYHIKRLVCESLSEIKPSQNDWPLFRRLYNTYPDLLKRTLIRLEGMGTVYGKDWFFFLSERLLPLFHSSTIDQKGVWLRLFVQSAKCWMNELPEATVRLWQQAIEESWFEHRTLARLISDQISHFNFIQVSGIKSILETFLSSAKLENEEYDGFISETISRWVDATNSGDELIWQYMTKKIVSKPSDETDYSWRPYEGLRCQPSTFHAEDFLHKRLESSNELLDRAISALKSWSQTQHGRALSYLLDETSWRIRYSQGDFPHSVTDISFLLSEIEQAVKSRASANDEWWRENVRDLLDSEEDAIAYLAIRACTGHISSNISEIEHCLLNQNLLFESRLTDEVGELIRNSYPYLSTAVQVKNQKLITDYSCDTNVDSEWPDSNLYRGYKLLRWIPTYLRTPKIQELSDQCQQKFGREELIPQILMSGGIMSMSPIGAIEILKLSDPSIFKLLEYYSEDKIRASMDSAFLEGCSIDFAIREASRIDPLRFLDICPFLTQKNVSYRCLSSILEGSSDHLRHRFDNLSFGKNLGMVEPLPDEVLVSTKIIEILERYPALLKDGRRYAGIIQGCCCSVSDESLADRLALLLFWLLSSLSDDAHYRWNRSSHHLHFNAANSGLGITANSAITLYNRLAEHEVNIPPLLVNAINLLSQHDESYVNLYVLAKLPYTIYKHPNFGWQLLENIFDKENFSMWKEAESIFYYNYDDNFDKIKLYLDKLAKEITDENGEVWGRISALSSLAGHIAQNELFGQLSHLNDSAAGGVAQVFCANLGKPQFRAECEAGLNWFLTQTSCSKHVLERVERCFSIKNNLNISCSFSNAFLDACEQSSEKIRLLFFPDWLANESKKEPLAIMEVLEKLVVFMNANNASLYTNRIKELIEALIEIEREADELDNPDIIQRTIYLQDQFLEMDLYGMSEVLDSATRI